MQTVPSASPQMRGRDQHQAEKQPVKLNPRKSDVMADRGYRKERIYHFFNFQDPLQARPWQVGVITSKRRRRKERPACGQTVTQMNPWVPVGRRGRPWEHLTGSARLGRAA